MSCSIPTFSLKYISWYLCRSETRCFSLLTSSDSYLFELRSCSASYLYVCSCADLAYISSFSKIIYLRGSYYACAFVLGRDESLVHGVWSCFANSYAGLLFAVGVLCCIILLNIYGLRSCSSWGHDCVIDSDLCRAEEEIRGSDYAHRRLPWPVRKDTRARNSPTICVDFVLLVGELGS